MTDRRATQRSIGDPDANSLTGEGTCVTVGNMLKRGLLAAFALLGFSGSESIAKKKAAVGPVEYLQLKVTLQTRKGLGLRAHFRFAPGDDSYNYLRAGLGTYVGLFHDPRLAANAKALVTEACKKLSAVTTRVTLAEAHLRVEDSAAFMQKMLKGEVPTEGFTSAEAVARLSIACSEPQGGAWKGEYEFNSQGELEAKYGDLIERCIRIGDAAAAAASSK